MAKRLFIRCRAMQKEGIGTFHVHSRWWSNQVCDILYTPPGSETLYEVPFDRYEEVIAASSFIEIMAILRRAASLEDALDCNPS